MSERKLKLVHNNMAYNNLLIIMFIDKQTLWYVNVGIQMRDVIDGLLKNIHPVGINCICKEKRV